MARYSHHSIFPFESQLSVLSPGVFVCKSPESISIIAHFCTCTEIFEKGELCYSSMLLSWHCPLWLFLLCPVLSSGFLLVKSTKSISVIVYFFGLVIKFQGGCTAAQCFYHSVSHFFTSWHCMSCLAGNFVDS